MLAMMWPWPYLQRSWYLHMHCLGHKKVVWMGDEADPMARCSPCTDGSIGSVIMWTVAVEPRITQDGQQMR